MRPTGDGTRPDIVMVVADDHGREAVGWFGNPMVSTPNIEERLDCPSRRAEQLDRRRPDPRRHQGPHGRLGAIPTRRMLGKGAIGLPADLETYLERRANSV